MGAGLLSIAVALASERFSLDWIGPWVVPLVAFGTGIALVWSPLDEASGGDARRPEVVVNLFSREHWPRVLVGFGLAIFGMWWFSRWEFTVQPVVRGIMVPSAILAALVLLFAPWWVRLIRQVSFERRQRVREFERAEIAAHLHDSVLQTLTLIRKHADDPAMVAKLARSQERDLRNYLYQDALSAEESVAAALAKAISEVEDAHGVVIDAVTVGDAPTDHHLRAAVKASREAASNAARHGESPISVYAEVTGGRFDVYVRDSGPGFNPKRVPADRMGIRQSILGRVERHGGLATETSKKGQRTEIHISMPLATTDRDADREEAEQ